ncbi:MAG: dephospho-CoA kinase [Bacteroidales bacterium]|nr:dephospho-CoA kinase [Bacteroidales bacterium]
MILKIGITGGIGSGKSVVSHLLRLMNVPVYDCDAESKRLVVENADIRKRLTCLVGKALYHKSELDKQMLASYIFDDESHLQAVNMIVHPVVKSDFYQWAALQAKHFSIVGMESAILIDAGFENAVDVVVNVSAPIDIRIQRAVLRDHSSAELIRKRMDKQLSDEERCRLSDITIWNDDVHPIIPQVFSFLCQLKQNNK